MLKKKWIVCCFVAGLVFLGSSADAMTDTQEDEIQERKDERIGKLAESYGDIARTCYRMGYLAGKYGQPFNVDWGHLVYADSETK